MISYIILKSLLRFLLEDLLQVEQHACEDSWKIIASSMSATVLHSYYDKYNDHEQHSLKYYISPHKRTCSR